MVLHCLCSCCDVNEVFLVYKSNTVLKVSIQRIFISNEPQFYLTTKYVYTYIYFQEDVLLDFDCCFFFCSSKKLRNDLYASLSSSHIKETFKRMLFARKHLEIPSSSGLPSCSSPSSVESPPIALLRSRISF